MSMLAKPRRKQKIINLRAKNNAWSNDNTKFGQRMLEKMGWSAGKGLGAKEDGSVEHVIARYKNDEKGLGYEDKNDQWTKHEDDFNSLLAELSNVSDNKDNSHSGISLELKSKKSKARVHYHKFTRGKDLSRYSEKDLACIFGKRALKKEDAVEKSVEDEDKVTDQIFTEKGSMEEYFKNKMASKKSIFGNENAQSQDNEDDKDFVFQGFAGTGSIECDNEKNENHQLLSSTNKNSDEIDCVDSTIMTQNKVVHQATKRKDKKSKKKKLICDLNLYNNVGDQLNSEYDENNMDQSKTKMEVKSSRLVSSESVEKIKTKKKRKNEIPSQCEDSVLRSKKRREC